MDRFFVETPLAGSCATLSGSEAHHLAHVLRATPGTVVTLFDGTGKEAEARVERVHRATIELTFEAAREVSREPVMEITLGVALPKGERQRWLVEKTVELGVRRLVPLSTQRSVAVPTEAALARLRRAVIEASKQCGRNHLMDVAPAQELRSFLEASSGDVRWLAHPGGEALPNAIRQLMASPAPHQWHLAIGPEGGFAPDEVATAQATGWQLIDLGPRILRVETAALCLVSAVGLIEG